MRNEQRDCDAGVTQSHPEGAVDRVRTIIISRLVIKAERSNPVLHDHASLYICIKGCVSVSVSATRMHRQYRGKKRGRGKAEEVH